MSWKRKCSRINIDTYGSDIFTTGTLQHWHYYRLSIYRGSIWCDNAHSTAIVIIKFGSHLHSRTTPHTPPFRVSYGVSSVSYAKKNDHDIRREQIVLFSYDTGWSKGGISTQFSIDLIRIGFIGNSCIIPAALVQLSALILTLHSLKKIYINGHH